MVKNNQSHTPSGANKIKDSTYTVKVADFGFSNQDNKRRNSFD
jgi:hypothetical protein